MLQVLSLRRYRHLFLAQVTALIGTGLTTVALALLAHDLAAGQAGIVLGTARAASSPLAPLGFGGAACAIAAAAICLKSSNLLSSASLPTGAAGRRTRTSTPFLGLCVCVGRSTRALLAVSPWSA